MRHPHIVIHDTDDWIARQLAELSGEAHWLVRTPTSCDTALSLVRERRPGVLVVRVEPAEEKPAALTLIADAHRLCPHVPVVAVSDVKLPDADRITWTAVLFDLGARYVLFPPLSKPVLEDVVSGLMAAAIRRAGFASPELPPPKEEVIDLADENLE